MPVGKVCKKAEMQGYGYGRMILQFLCKHRYMYSHEVIVKYYAWRVSMTITIDNIAPYIL